MPQRQVIRVSSVIGNITPVAFQYFAKDFYDAYSTHSNAARFSPARLFLLSRSIELAAKSLHLARGKSADDIRKMGHDLERSCDLAMLASYGIQASKETMTELKKANRYYKGKGFEYFLFDYPGVAFDRSGPQQALRGWPDLPDVSVLAVLATSMLDQSVT